MKNKYLEILNSLHKETSDVDINSRVLIVDGLNNYIRSFSVCPVVNDDGLHIGGLTGFLMTVGFAIKHIRPTRVIIAWDGAGGSQRRRKVFGDYKGNRKPGSPIKRSPLIDSDEDVHESMIRQSIRLMQYLGTLPLTTIVVDNIEADDTIAYLVSLIRQKGGNSYIMSTDRDFLQLVNTDVAVWSPTKKKLYFKDEVKEEYFISANNYLLYRLITGDKGDNIPGVPGIGPKTLVKKVPQLAEDVEMSVDDLLAFCEANPKDNTLAKILAAKDIIKRNETLMQLKDVDISGSAKLKIVNAFESIITPYSSRDFLNLLVEDRAANAIKNVQMWSREVFGPLHSYATSHIK